MGSHVHVERGGVVKCCLVYGPPEDPAQECVDCPLEQSRFGRDAGGVCCGTTKRPSRPSLANPANCQGCPGRHTCEDPEGVAAEEAECERIQAEYEHRKVSA